MEQYRIRKVKHMKLDTDKTLRKGRLIFCQILQAL